MATSNFTAFNASLPTIATERLNRIDRNNPDATQDLPSYFNAEITNGGLLNGFYDTWCFRSDLFVPTGDPFGPELEINVYSSYDTIPDGVLQIGLEDGNGDSFLDNLQATNWILNFVTEEENVVDGKYRFNGVDYTLGDIQLTIWKLLTPTNPDGTLTDNLAGALPSLGDFDEDRANQLAALAKASGSDFVPMIGQDIAVLVSPGGEDPTRQPQILEVETVGLGNFVWEDLNADGIQDGNEVGIDGVTVKLLADTDGDGDFEVIATTVTGDNVNTAAVETGYYEFGPLLPGEYKVMFNNPDSDVFMFSPQYAPTGTLPAQNPGTDSNADPSTGMTDIITLTPGEFDNNFNDTIDAGLFRKASIGDFVWEDINGDGIRNNNELNAGINGVSVKLLADTDNDGQIDDVVQTTVTQTNSDTNRDGFYQFTGLTPGVEYKVMFNNPNPNNFMFTQQYAPTGSLPAQNPGRDSNADPSNGMSEVIVLNSGENNRTIDAGLFRKASIGDFVWEDINGDGIRNNNELNAGINGVRVKLLADTDNDGQIDDVVQTTVTQTNSNTNRAGFYQFTGLTPGVEYKVMFNNPNPSNFMFTQQYAPTGSLPAQNPGRDSNADPVNGMSEVITLSSGENNRTIDAGLIVKDPRLDIEKFTNGVDADRPDQAVEIAAGEVVTWTYQVTNTGNVTFAKGDIKVTDDQEGLITNIIDQGDGDNFLAPNETWIYQEQAVAQQLATSTDQTHTFYLGGSDSGWLDGPDGNIRTFTAGDISVKTSAFSRTYDGHWSKAYLGKFSSGLGVTDSGEGNGSGSRHKVDNIYRDNFVLFEFSQDVVVDEAFLDSVGYDSDITYWVGNANAPFNNHNMLNDAFIQNLEYGADNNTNSSHSRWVDLNPTEVAGNVLVIAASTSDQTPDDEFKIKKVEVKKVEPVLYRNEGAVTAPGAMDSDLSHYVNPEAPTDPPLLFSLKDKKTIDGVTFKPEDIVKYNPSDHSFQKFFDGSDVGLWDEEIDAFEVIDDNKILLSFASSTYNIGNLGYVDDSDIVQFTATSLGEHTAGSFQKYFDGSDVGLTTSGEDIDGLAIDPITGDLLISTRGDVNVSGLGTKKDEDILRFKATRLGSSTRGTWSVEFDGSDVSLSSSDEDIDAIGLAADKLLLSTKGSFHAGGISGSDQDVFAFHPTSTGSHTSGTFEVFFDKLHSNDISGIDLLA